MKMGVRYRKSVKICKGVRVNFSKSGVSYTVGTRGASVNFGKNGTYMNAGIPGTGVYARERLDGGSDHSGAPAETVGESQPVGIDVVMDDRGRVKLLRNGVEIMDESLIRKIKVTPAFQEEKRRLEALRRQKINELLEEDRKSNDDILKLYQKAPAADGMKAFVEKLNSLQPETYARKSFQLPPPEEEKIRNELTIEAEKNVNTWMFWKRNKLRREYVSERIMNALYQARAQWEDQKAAFEAKEDVEEEKENKQLLHDFEMTKLGLQKSIEGDPDFLGILIDSWISDCTMPFDVNIDYSYLPEDKKLLLDVDLPEIEDIPDTKMVKLASGNLSQKKKTQAELKQDYAALVFSLVIFLSANLFALSPAIEKITMSCYTQRRNTAGDIEDNYILSVKFERAPFEKESFQKANPMEFCMGFENRCNMTSTMLFKKIKPFEE